MADFSIAMTGTPVENSLADLWSIADIVAPGMLPALKDFVRTYTVREPESLERLSRTLLGQDEGQQSSSVPPFALRRMKSDIAKELPKKNDAEMLQIEDMGGLQAEKYADVDARAQAGNVPMLRALHDFRSVSLHPIDPAALGREMGDADYITHSARFRRAFEILRQVQRKDEKVLIFLHSKKVQNVLAVLIERTLRCPIPKIVRGDVLSHRRQEIVDEFSARPGFGVLILSPRAAGVGLNIVAANHVIHLDRWWNPAVEDQCTDRAYRIGQTKPVWVYALAARHPIHGERSYDLILHQILERKRQLSRHIFAPGDLQPGDFDGLFGGKPEAPMGRDQLLSRIDAMTPNAFEEWVRDSAIADGFAARLTMTSSDGGADVVVKDAMERITHLIQCKHTSRIELEIDSGMTADISRMRDSWRAPDAKVIGVTNARRFSRAVSYEAHTAGAILINRDTLLDLGDYLRES